MGDFNGHLVEIDGREDDNGRRLRQMSEDCELEILNLREECVGQRTWMLRDCDIEVVCRDFEEINTRTNALTYEEYAGELKQAIATHSVVRGTPGKRRLVPWWDAEIRRAIQRRQEANREHHRALRALGKAPETLRLWEEYQALKAKTHDIVKGKRQAHDCKKMADIRKGGRKAGEKFWQYIGTLDGKDSTPHLIDAENKGEIQNMKELLDQHLDTLFGMTQEGYEPGNMPTGSPYVKDSSLPTSTNDSQTVVGRVLVDRALARLNGMHCTGLGWNIGQSTERPRP
ncbi:hypothetical protein HPB47_005708 [Ixodes persulcatus]|uniref:Uncharacterized protein n=1 Tax=Ixodes persulcatus TaxID=34615 RepID=A0AC60PC85_IXOPE|nr:hypothetical protein HPB47_005708 [Ixodes persulcatus]